MRQCLSVLPGVPAFAAVFGRGRGRFQTGLADVVLEWSRDGSPGSVREHDDGCLEIGIVGGRRRCGISSSHEMGEPR
jgi:hypothetical protein